MVVTMTQLELFDVEPPKRDPWPGVPADLTCVVCGKTEPNEYVYSINHSYGRPGWCMSQHLRQNHVKSFLRSLARIDAGEPITNARGKDLTATERLALRASVTRQLAEACERAVDATTTLEQVVAVCAERGYTTDGQAAA